jgi:hypothetical protein
MSYLKRYATKFDVDLLKADLEWAGRWMKFESSYHKHSISLLNEEMIPETHKNFHNNKTYNEFPLYEWKYFYKIWEQFNKIGEITCFRIMRKKQLTAYGLHNDVDAGDILRFQIPIQTNDSCFLALTNVNEIKEGWTEDDTYFTKDLQNRFGDDVNFYQMESGYLYHFDTNKIHTLVNEGHTTRYTLLFDMKKTDMLLDILDKKFEKVDNHIFN